MKTSPLPPEFATICGYPQHDLETVFAEHLQGADMAEVRRWYNGYNAEMDDFIYLIEFKVDMPGEKALAQLKARGCAE